MAIKVSVALCTYQGAVYLREQLDSILQQTRPVDEVVVYDDGSRDETLAILEQYQKNSQIPFHIHQNSKNLGSSKNFEQCLQACSGDVLFLSDQDDRWMPEKVARQLAFLEQFPRMDAVFSNALMMDQHGHPTGESAFEKIEFTPEAQGQWKSGAAFDILLRGYVVTGATVAVKKAVVPEVFPTPELYPELIHDGWLALYLSMFDRIGFVDDPLIFYRTHEAQQVGLKSNGTKITIKDRLQRSRDAKLARIQCKQDKAQVLLDYLASRPGLPPAKVQKLKDRCQHYQTRLNLPAPRWSRWVPVLKLWLSGSYRQQEQGKWWHTLLGDLFE